LAAVFSNDKPDRFFTVIKFWMDKISGVALDLKTGVPSYQVEDEEGRTYLLIHLAVDESEDRWCLWRLDQAALIRDRSLSVGSSRDRNRSLFAVRDRSHQENALKAD
jgi:hypothetical protein